MDMEAYFEKEYYVVDILPRQVPKDSPGQYFAVEEYYLGKERLKELRKKFLNILLKLSCYYNIALSCDWGESLKEKPSPEELAECFAKEDPFLPVYVILESEDTLLALRPDDLYMTVYGPSQGLIDLLSLLAGAEGLFTWKPCAEGESDGQ